MIDIIILSSLKQQHLQEFYNIKDSINYLWKGEYKTIHSLYILELKYPGKYVDFLELLSCENDFMSEYYENYRLVEIINLLTPDGIVLD